MLMWWPRPSLSFTLLLVMLFFSFLKAPFCCGCSVSSQETAKPSTLADFALLEGNSLGFVLGRAVEDLMLPLPGAKTELPPCN